MTTAPWSVGETRVFAAQLDSRVVAASQALVDVAVTGAWKLTRVENGDATSARAIRAVGELAVSQLRLTTSPESEPGLRATLGETVVFDISERGVVTGVGFAKGQQPDGTYAVSRGLLRALVASLQVAQPKDHAAKSWSAAELDFSGSYEATYERTGTRALRKAKRSYSGCPSCGPTQAQTRVVRSRIDLEFVNDSLSPLALSSVASDEATRVQGGAPLPDMSAETKVKLRLVASQPLDTKALAATAARVRDVRLQAIDNRGLDKRAILDDAKIAGTSFKSLADQISLLDRQGQRASGPRARAYAQMAAHLRYDTEAVEEALRRIRSGDPSRDTLIDALGSAGSEAAQAALRELFADRNASESDRQNVALGLSFTPKPSDGTIKLLADLQDDPTVGRQSRYGLGIAAYQLSSDEPSRAEAIVSGLESRLANATTNEDVIEYLRALGNAASSSSLAAIEPYLHDENVSVRAAAVNALRRIPGPLAEQYLAYALLGDKSAEVRLTAASSLDYRGSSTGLVAALERSLTGEPDRDVRLQATRVAVKWATKETALRDELSGLAQSDPDKKIREVAGAAG